MAVSDDFRNFVLDQLDGIGPLHHRHMFGGVGFWCEGAFFAILYDETLYLKCDAALEAELREAGGDRFRPRGDSGRMRFGYWSVPAALLEDADELARVARRAVAVARESR